MNTKTFKIIGVFLFTGLMQSYAQPNTQWDRNYNGPVNGMDRVVDMDADNLGNIYVTGNSDSTFGVDYVTIKYSPNGAILWRKRFNGAANLEDYPNALKYDPTNDALYVTGKSKVTGSGYDFLTIRYDAANGNVIWTIPFDAGLNLDDEAVDVDVDATGNVFILGHGFTNSFNLTHQDVLTQKYDANAVLNWQQIRTNSFDDYMSHVLLVNNNNAYFVYSDFTSGTTNNKHLYGYNTNGIPLYSFGQDYFGNVTLPVKYNMTADGAGNIYFCGRYASVVGGNQDIFINKANSNLSSNIWSALYDGISSGSDEATDIIVDGSNNVYITGYTDITSGTGINNNMLTIKLDNLGDTIWTRKYNGISNGDDRGVAIARNNFGSPDIYVTGYTTQSNGTKDITTIKYDNNGNQLCVYDYNCPANNEDYPVAMYRDPTDNIYVGGYNSCNNTNEDFLLIKLCLTCSFVCPVGVNEPTSNYSFLISPNPATNNFTLQLNSKLIGAELQIFNALGNKIYYQNIDYLSTQINLKIPAGFYIVKVTDGENVISQKLIIE